MIKRVHLVCCSALMVMSCAAAWSASVESKGGRGVVIRGNVILNGGTLKIDGSYPDTEECIHSEPGTQWTFQGREDRAIQYPDYLASSGNANTKHFDVSVSEGENPITQKVNQPPDLHAWYKQLTFKILDNFKPQVRGAIMVDAKFAPGGLDTVQFSRYNYKIPFKRADNQPAPPVIAPSSNEEKLKESILSALKTSFAESSSLMPSGVSSVEVKIVFAGDPQGKSGYWTNILVDPY
ncbi:MAG: hypothetical protein JST89_26670 [Cyanobacteria bacterium SZAS-4]|nr:hypothetical protein [Cyanobacteria bacterium SZAS-4]